MNRISGINETVPMTPSEEAIQQFFRSPLYHLRVERIEGTFRLRAVNVAQWLWDKALGNTAGYNLDEVITGIESLFGERITKAACEPPSSYGPQHIPPTELSVQEARDITILLVSQQLQEQQAGRHTVSSVNDETIELLSPPVQVTTLAPPN